MFYEKLNWRYATKAMDPAKKVPAEKIDRIVEAARMAPTSSGLQPFEIFVVYNDGVRAQLSEAAFGQRQLVDGTAVLVFAAWDNYSDARIDEFVDLTAEVRGSSDGLKEYFDRLKGMYLPREADVNF